MHSENIKGIHIYANGLEFPLALYERSDWDSVQMGYINLSKHTTKSLIKWCDNHHIDYTILYPLKKTTPFRHPFRHLRYLRLVKTI